MITEMIKQIDLDFQETYSHEEVIEMLSGIKSELSRISKDLESDKTSRYGVLIDLNNIIGDL
jgi:hypothetical protein